MLAKNYNHFPVEATKRTLYFGEIISWIHRIARRTVESRTITTGRVSGPLGARAQAFNFRGSGINTLFMRGALILSVLWLGLMGGRGDSTIDPTASHAYAANAGWINLRPSAADGVVLGHYVCSGWLWSGNVGWISLGGGTPANGIRYSNQAANDFGVNHDGRGHLSGYAYGANIGWIQFEPRGNPAIDLLTGRLSGHIWSANVGWISLSGLSFETRTLALDAGKDSNKNGIADAWELERIGSLNLLKHGGDLDGDGILDEDEYLADTNPNGRDSFLRITTLTVAPKEGLAHISFAAADTRTYQLRGAAQLGSPWNEAPAKIEIQNGIGVFHTPLSSDAGQNFFRVAAKLPLAP